MKTHLLLILVQKPDFIAAISTLLGHSLAHALQLHIQILYTILRGRIYCLFLNASDILNALALARVVSFISVAR
jgi:hypothetical protein